MHKLVFEEGGLDDGTELAYFVRGKVVAFTPCKKYLSILIRDGFS